MAAMQPAAETRGFGTPAFERVRRLIHEIAGISLGATKRTMAFNRLMPRVEATESADFRRYLDLVEAPGSEERVHFANALTTNLTSFFREPHHFPVLIEHLRQAGPGAVVWSAACSTGEEAYSIVMALEEAGIDPRVRVIASDVDTTALAAAQDGIYRMDRAGALGEERLRRFFQRGAGNNNGYARVRPELRARVSFRRINLAEPKWNVEGPLAAIFCRNAMIYFGRPLQLEVLQRFHPLIRDGGLLFAGHSENFHYLAGHFLRALGKTVYEPIG
ncbi:MAG TPA: CheR family methyltransferase [Usitatibacter sp.]|nr:CheR family methyltransferase [Usitatibacter sp.]